MRERVHKPGLVSVKLHGVLLALSCNNSFEDFLHYLPCSENEIVFLYLEKKNRLTFGLLISENSLIFATVS
jgi:hypothetical protein